MFQKPSGPSLLELHQKKLASKQVDPQEVEEKQRWNRERDLLGVGKTMSRTSREQLIREASNLHSRFTNSSK